MTDSIKYQTKVPYKKKYRERCFEPLISETNIFSSKKLMTIALFSLKTFIFSQLGI